MSPDRPAYANFSGFFDYCPWKFLGWATQTERSAQLERQAALIALGNVEFGTDCFIAPSAGVYPQRLIMGDRCYIGGLAYVTDDVVMGDDCTINPFAILRGTIKIGSGVRIAANASLIGFNHGHSDLETPIFKQPETSLGICIGDDVWIASGVTILDGVKIGSHCILAANAVITKDVPDYAVMAGNPARVIRNRKARTQKPNELTTKLELFGQTARQEHLAVLERCSTEIAGQQLYLQQPEYRPTVRAWCDATEISHLFGETPTLLPKEALITKLQGFQDASTGLIPDPWADKAPDNPWRLSNHLSRYHLLAVGYALELLGSQFLYPIKAVEQLTGDALIKQLESLDWQSDAWMSGDWIDCYATGAYINLKHFSSQHMPHDLFGWLHSHVNRFSGVWGSPRSEDGWLQPVNGFYRLTRGSFAQFGLPVPHPERAIDTVLAHSQDPRFFGLYLSNACNVLDVIHPLWLCGLQTTYRQTEIRLWAGQQLERVLQNWQPNQGFSFALERHNQASLQGTEMWLAITYLLAEVLGSSAALGYQPRGVHRLQPAWSVQS